MKEAQNDQDIAQELALSYQRLTVVLRQAKWSIFRPESYATIEKMASLYTDVGFIKVYVDEVRLEDQLTIPVVTLFIGDVMVDMLQEKDVTELEKRLAKWSHIVDPAGVRYCITGASESSTANAKFAELTKIMNATEIDKVFERDPNFLQHIVEAISWSFRAGKGDSMELFRFTLNLQAFFASPPEHVLSQKLNLWLFKFLETTINYLDLRRKCAILLAMCIHKRISLAEYCEGRHPFLTYITNPYTLLQLPPRDVEFVLLSVLALRIASPSATTFEDFVTCSRAVIVHFPLQIQALFSLCSSNLFDMDYNFGLTLLSEIV
uniref:Uncharacterized protein n=1 Tax=Trichuris muris TaxID=70415 RepID=A0A5S6QJT2_TRIMR